MFHNNRFALVELVDRSRGTSETIIERCKTFAEVAQLLWHAGQANGTAIHNNSGIAKAFQIRDLGPGGQGLDLLAEVTNDPRSSWLYFYVRADVKDELERVADALQSATPPGQAYAYWVKDLAARR